MLAKDPAQRFAHAGEVLAALAAIGAVSALPLLPTLAAPIKTKAAPPESEQVLLSLVMACYPPDGEGSTVPSPNAQTEIEHHSALLLELRALGAQADALLGGALAVRVPPMGSAKDQVIAAVRAALMIQEHWPEARIAVVTGRGRLSHGLTTGEAIDRAWSLLSRPPSIGGGSAEPSTSRIWVDEVSAGLLAPRFELKPVTGGGFVLGGERLDMDQGRLLLGRPTPCVGRERELAMLEAMLTECQEESVARGMLVLAPPGMGKSRLWHESVRRMESRGEALCKLIGRGDPMKAKASYGLLAEALRGRCGITDSQDLTAQQALLRESVKENLPKDQTPRITEFLGELCGVHFADSDSAPLRAARQDARLMGDQVEQAWLDWVRAMAEKQLVLLILEDLHWADALTMKLVHAVLRELPNHPLMMLLLGRPEVLELYPKLGSGTVQQMPLNPLPKKASERLVRLVLGTEDDAGTVARIVEQSTGNPLFLEELIRANQERGEVPGTVMAMLQARIGRLSVRGRRTLRAASVFGQLFWENGIRTLLAATHGSDSSSTELELEELVREEIIEAKRDRRRATEPEYSFRHTLMRDAAYELVSTEEATAWHAAAGTFLAKVGIREAVVLAEHFRLGREMPRAITCYVAAAEQAYEAGDLDAALICIHHGLTCGAAGQEQGTLLGIQALIFMWRGQFERSLGPSLEALTLLTVGSKPWCRCFEALFPAMGLMQPSGLPPLLAQFMAGQPAPEARAFYIHAATWVSVMLGIAGQKKVTTLLVERLRQVGADLMDKDLNVRAHVLGAEASFQHHIHFLPEQNLGLNRESERAFAEAGNRTVQVIMGSHVGKSLLDMGQRAEARQVLEANMRLAEQLRDETPLSYARVYLARLLATSEAPADWARAEEQASKVLGTQNLTMVAQARFAQARVHWNRGNLAAAEAEAHATCDLLRAFPGYRPEAVALWSRILAAQSNPAQSLAVCQEEAEQIEALGLEGSGLLDLYAALADAYIRCGKPEAARPIVERALSILRQRADDIPDPARRAVYLSANSENSHLMALAVQWGIDQIPRD